MTANRTLLRAGFLLFLLALLTGFAIPAFRNQKMALGAHLTGVMNGLVLIALGFAWGYLALRPAAAKAVKGLFLYSAYANWATTCLAAAWGTSRLAPLNGAGFSAAPWQETIVEVLQVSLALAIVAGAALVVYGLRPAAASAAEALPRAAQADAGG
jgi:(hydroxyamino)benzene mutase